MKPSQTSDREARKRALDAAKEKLQKRRKQREELKLLKEAGGSGIGSSSKNDYGRELINRALEFKKDLDSEAKESLALEESGNGGIISSSSVDVPGPRVELSLVTNINAIDLNKRELMEYGKEIQTDAFEIAQSANIISDENENISEKEMNKIMACFNSEDMKPWPPKLNSNLDGISSGAIKSQTGENINNENVNKNDNNNNNNTNNENELKKQENEEKEKEKESFVMEEGKAIELMNEKVFSNSFGIKSYLMEHLISSNEEHSIFYEVDEIGNENENETQLERLILKEKLLMNSLKGRSITNLNVSPNGKYLLASHSSLGLLNGYFLDSTKAEAEIETDTQFDDSSFDGTEGIINIWEIESLNRKNARFELICQSMVTTAKFHPTNENLVIAATVSGQVLGWDMEQKKTPIMRTQFSSGHNAPVFSMGFLSKNENIDLNLNNNEKQKQKNTQTKHIVTVSNDGRVCVWRDDFLVDPLSEFILKLGNEDNNNKDSNVTTTTTISGSSNSNNEDLSTTCFSSLSTDGNMIVFGSDDGCLYKCNEMMSDRIFTGAKSIIDSVNTTHGTHSTHGTSGISGSNSHSNAYDLNVDGSSNYFIDDTNKGNTKKFSHFGPISSVEFHPYFTRLKYSLFLYLTCSFDWTVKLWHYKHKEPICTFAQMSDYVYDVKWSPARPSVFVCGDGLGKLTIFDLLNDFDSPVAVFSTNDENSKKQVSITRIEWQKDGKCLFVGDSQGTVSIYDVSPSLYETSDADLDRFEAIIRQKL